MILPTYCNSRFKAMFSQVTVGKASSQPVELWPSMIWRCRCTSNRLPLTLKSTKLLEIWALWGCTIWSKQGFRQLHAIAWSLMYWQYTVVVADNIFYYPISSVRLDMIQNSSPRQTEKEGDKCTVINAVMSSVSLRLRYITSFSSRFLVNFVCNYCSRYILV